MKKLLQTLILFFTFAHSLLATEALPLLVKAGEPFENRKDFYIPSRSLVYAVAISPDGKTIVSGSDDNSIKIWDKKTGKLLKSLEGHTSYVNSVAISPDGKTIVSGSMDNSVKIWDKKRGKLLKSLDGHTYSVSSVAISTDGKTIVSGSRDNSVKIWDKKTGKLLKSLEGHTDPVHSIAISPDGKTIVSGSDDGSVKIWDKKRGKLLKILEGHTSYVSSVAISPDGKTIVSGSYDNSVKIWDKKTGKLLKSLEGHTSPVSSIAISPDGKTIVSGSWDNSVKIWDKKIGKLLKSLEGHTSTVSSVAISPDGKTIVSGSDDNSVKIWDKKTGKVLKEFLGGMNGCWMVTLWDASPKIFNRGDDGTFLYQKGKHESLRLAEPKWLGKEDKVSFEAKKQINTLSERAYDYEVKIKNEANEKLYWIEGAYQDDYCTVLEQRLSNLESKAEKTLTFSVFCKVPRHDPTPIKNHLINLELTTATKSKFVIPLSVNIGSAQLKVLKAERSKDKKNLNVLVQNVGDVKLLKADVNLSLPFQADIQTLTNLEANATKTLSFVLPENNQSIEGNISISFSVANEKEILNNPSGTKIAPAYVWQVDNVTIVLNKMAWYVYGLWALGVLVLLGLIVYYKRYKNPMVIKLETPKELMNLKPEELKEAKERLSKIGRFKNILSENSISSERYENALDFESLVYAQKAENLAKRTFSKVTSLSESFYVLELNDDFSLNIKQFILFFSDKESLADMMGELKAIPQYRTQTILLLCDSSEVQEQLYLERDKHEKLVLIEPKTITQMLLAVDGAKVLADAFATQLALTQISPYKLGGGVEKSSMFFGRSEIVSHILGRENNNYVIIGSRQIGKSSLLKAIHREYENAGEKSYYISLNVGDIVRGIAKALGLKTRSLEELVNFMQQSDEVYIFLIDEADKFIKDERASGYEILNSFRKLSEEGRCYFILAGFWELYQYAILDFQSPLKNFGEIMELGALEHDACREMIVEPLSQLGLSFESETEVEEIIERTGRRANIIAIICNNIIKKIGKEKRVIDKVSVQNAIKEKNVYELFEAWRELTPDNPKANKLDRIIVYATVKKGEFELSELIELLKSYEFEVDFTDLERSLDRLKVSYTLDVNDKGTYFFRLPLFREYVLKSAFEVKLVQEIKGY